MHHSPHPCGDKDAASETAARAALESLGLIPCGAPVVSRRGGGHRGHRDHGHANRHQPWVAEYSGQYPAPRVQRSDNNVGLAGTEQMDIRYRDKKPDPRIPGEQVQDDRKMNKPAFVPTQVIKKSVKQPSKEKSKERDDAPQLPDLERVEGTVIKKEQTASPRSSVSKESTPTTQRTGRGRGQPRGGNKRMAANFD